MDLTSYRSLQSLFNKLCPSEASFDVNIDINSLFDVIRMELYMVYVKIPSLT